MALVSLIVACGTEPPSSPEPDPVASVEVSPGIDTLTAIDQSVQLTAVPRDDDGAALTGKSIAWNSSDGTIASVSTSGRVTARAAGTATITATVGNAIGSTTIVVRQIVQSVRMSPSTWQPDALTLTQQITATPVDANDHPVAGAVLTWESTDSAVVTVAATGLATALTNGAALVTATVGEVVGQSVVTVAQAVANVTVSPEAWSPGALGVQQQFTAIATDATDHPVVDWALTWVTSDTSVVRVDPAGVATATGVGAATIEATTSGVAESADVMVVQQIDSIVVTPATDTLRPLGTTRQMGATALDQNGQPITGVTFTWSSSNTVAVPVTTDGLITASGLGTVTITASAGGVTGNATITTLAEVAPPIVSIRTVPEEWTATMSGAKQQFRAIATDANGDESPLVGETWTSTNPAIASVDGSGVVTALTSGDVLLIATTGGFADTASITVDASGAIADGVVWSMYFPQLIESPALIQGGALQTPGLPQVPYAYPSPYTGGNVMKFQWEQERIGVLTDVVATQGSFRVRDRVGEWVDLALGNATDFQLEGNRIGVLLGNGSLRVKDGTYGPWSNIASAVASFKLEGNRIMALNIDGTLYAKDGPSGAWILLANGGVVDYQMSGNRIAIVLADGRLRVKEGISGAWTTLGSAAAKVILGGNRIGVLNLNGTFFAKDGISGQWVQLASGGVVKYQFEGNRIGELLNTGRFRVKTGLNGAWSTLATTGITDFDLVGTRIGMVGTDGRVRVKNGAFTAPWTFDATFPGVTQFAAAVAAPIPPYRTTPVNYAAGQESCRNDAKCEPSAYIPISIIPVPYYGRACGYERTGGVSIDGMDRICYHHDRSGEWYGTATGSLGNDRVGACIVRYGMLNARMTRHGALLQPGTAAYNTAFGLMPETREAMRQYMIWTSSCTDYFMNQFIEDTRLGL